MRLWKRLSDVDREGATVFERSRLDFAISQLVRTCLGARELFAFSNSLLPDAAGGATTTEPLLLLLAAECSLALLLLLQLGPGPYSLFQVP